MLVSRLVRGSTRSAMPSRGAFTASGLSARDLLRVVGVVLLAFLLAKLVLLVVLALNSAFVMDEYWMAGHGLFNIDNLYKEVWPAKTVLYAAFFRVAHALGDGAVQVMLSARVQSTAVAIAGLGLLYLIARGIGRSRLEALFVVCVVLAFASYIEWAFMVRPEPLALFLALGALWAATRKDGRLRACFAAGLLSGLAFLTMQKAVYFNFALGVALVGDGLVRRSLKDAFFSGAALVLGWGLVVLAYILFFSAQGADFMAVLRHIFLGPSMENALAEHKAYGTLRSFVGRTLFRDLALYPLCATGLALSLPRMLHLSRRERRAWIFTVVIAALVFAHRSPWPYNFIMAIPFLALWSTVLPRLLLGRTMPVRAAFGALIALVFGVSLARNVTYLDHDNAFQNETVRRAESLLDRSDTYTDGIGMVVTRRQAGMQWPGQVVSWDRSVISAVLASAERGDFAHIETVIEGAPKVWILSYRTNTLQEVLRPYLRNAYVPVFSNLLIAGAALPPGEDVFFENRWPGAYRLYRADGTPVRAPLVVDGRALTGVVELEKGPHSLRLDKRGQTLYLLPNDITVSFDLTQPREQQALFDRTYTF